MTPRRTVWRAFGWSWTRYTFDWNCTFWCFISPYYKFQEVFPAANKNNRDISKLLRYELKMSRVFKVSEFFPISPNDSSHCAALSRVSSVLCISNKISKIVSHDRQDAGISPEKWKTQALNRRTSRQSCVRVCLTITRGAPSPHLTWKKKKGKKCMF